MGLAAPRTDPPEDLCRDIVHIRADRALDFFHLADRPSAIGVRVKGFQRQHSLASEADFHGITSFQILQ
jgi:hypothetical protein